jgi:hypothetical protein
MRKLIGGLLGLCLLAALVPVEASARTDARANAQSSSSSRSASSRQAATRPSATSSSRSATRSSDRGRATVSHAATRSRSSTSYASARGNRGLNGPVAAAVPYGRSAAMPQGRGLRRTAMASCSLRHGRRTCTTTTASRGEVMRWTGGLAPAAMSQSDCPDGTIATMAVGHNDITRCVPL